MLLVGDRSRLAYHLERTSHLGGDLLHDFRRQAIGPMAYDAYRKCKSRFGRALARHAPGTLWGNVFDNLAKALWPFQRKTANALARAADQPVACQAAKRAHTLSLGWGKNRARRLHFLFDQGQGA